MQVETDVSTSQGTARMPATTRSQERGKKGPSPPDFTGSMTLLTIWFHTSVPLERWDIYFCCLIFLTHTHTHKTCAHHLLKAYSSSVPNLRKWHSSLTWEISPLWYSNILRTPKVNPSKNKSVVTSLHEAPISTPPHPPISFPLILFSPWLMPHYTFLPLRST